MEEKELWLDESEEMKFFIQTMMKHVSSCHDRSLKIIQRIFALEDAVKKLDPNFRSEKNEEEQK